MAGQTELAVPSTIDHTLVDAFKRQEADAIVPKALALAVNTNEAYAQAGLMLVSLRGLRKKADQFFADTIKKTHDSWKAALGLKEAAIGEVDQAERHLNAQMKAHVVEINRQRMEAERKEKEAQAERDRLARIEFDKAETARLAKKAIEDKERDDARLAIAAQAEDSGNPELADEILDTPEPELPADPEPAAAPVSAPVPAAPLPALPTAPGVAVRANWKANVTDVMLLVKAVAQGQIPPVINDQPVLVPNMTALNAMARGFRRQEMMCPGVNCYDEGTLHTGS